MRENGDAAGQNGGDAHVGAQRGGGGLGIADIVNAALGAELNALVLKCLAQVENVQNSKLVAGDGLSEAVGDFVGRVSGRLAVDHGGSPFETILRLRICGRRFVKDDFDGESGGGLGATGCEVDGAGVD